MFKTKFLPTIIATIMLLAIPFIGMQFSDQVAWNLGDFVIAAILILGAGFTFEIAARKGGRLAYKLAVASAVGTPLLLVWANLAVGLIGNEDNPANLLYLGVALLAIGGSVVSRFKIYGMYRTMIVSAIAQLLVPVLAYFIYRPEASVHDLGMVGVFLASAVFAFMFFASAYLFKAAQSNDEA